jgi:monoamine oxidase
MPTDPVSGSQPDAGGLTRRAFLTGLAGLAGAGAAWRVLEAWGAAPASPAPPALSGSGAGTRVLILGAGLAGLTAAYELAKLGYGCRILEARERAGGRCWTVRQGEVLDEVGGERQVCTFDEGLFFNPGPWRIPHTHASTLHYCRTFGVAVEVFVNDNEAAYAYAERAAGPLAGRPLRLRELRADLHGHTAELLAKVADRAMLDRPLTAEDVERLLDYLVAAGGLARRDLRYAGDDARGYRRLPGAGPNPGEVGPSADMAALLPVASRLARVAPAALAGVAPAFFQMTMLHPLGGMDLLARGFERALGDRIAYRAPVREIRQSPDGVRVIYTDPATGAAELAADYCICTLPLSVLRDIPADVAPDMARAVRGVSYAATGKIGLQMGRRFWEEDEGIFGGITYTDAPEIGTIGYPSSGYLTRKGVLQGYYNFGGAAVDVGRLTPAARAELSLRHGAKIHPAYRSAFESAFSVAWQRVPYSLGGWAAFSAEDRRDLYPRLGEPDGRLYLAGEHLSYLPGWQAGAIESAWATVEQLHRRIQAAAP